MAGRGGAGCGPLARQLSLRYGIWTAASDAAGCIPVHASVTSSSTNEALRPGPHRMERAPSGLLVPSSFWWFLSRVSPDRYKEVFQESCRPALPWGLSRSLTRFIFAPPPARPPACPRPAPGGVRSLNTVLEPCGCTPRPCRPGGVTALHSPPSCQLLSHGRAGQGGRGSAGYGGAGQAGQLRPALPG